MLEVYTLILEKGEQSITRIVRLRTVENNGDWAINCVFYRLSYALVEHGN